MARIRTIKPELPHSETLGSVSRDARLLFINLFTIADDSGRGRATSRLLASLLYPYDDDAGELIDGWLGELHVVGAIRLYEVNSTRYFDIPKWLEHQKIDKPSASRLPEYSREFAKPLEGSSADLGPSTLDRGPSTSIPLYPPEGENPKRAKKALTSIREDWTLTEQDYNHAAAKGLDHPTITAVAEQFRDHHTAKGSRFKDWGAAWRTWVGNHINFHGKATWPANGARQPGRNNGTADALSSYVRKYIIGQPVSDGPGMQRPGRDGFDQDAPGGRLGNGKDHAGPIIDADEFERVPQVAGQA